MALKFILASAALLLYSILLISMTIFCVVLTSNHVDELRNIVTGDVCYINQCQNGGTMFQSCSDGRASENCSCKAGFTGRKCEKNIDECSFNPCRNGGTCIDGVASYNCTCKAGYNGINCENNIDDCSPNPCQSGEKCIDGVASHKCTCQDGFTGTRCEINIDDCSPNPCQNNGTCKDLMNDFECQCPILWTGKMCDRHSPDIDDCSPNPCHNGGTCTDGVASYNCTCQAGFTGTRCEINIDECSPNPCQNGGTCIDGVVSYNCTCKAGYNGINCENNIDDCSPIPCQNGGTCIDGVASYNCTCSSKHNGSNCEITKTNEEFLTCNFEKGFCNWIQPHISNPRCTNHFYWDRHKGRTKYYLAGPSIDHTTASSSGYYTYIQTTSPLQEGDKAYLKIKPVNGTDCLKFYYHMCGADIGSLNVYVNGRRVFHKSSHQGDKWLPGEFEFRGADNEIVFEGVRGKRLLGVIALDDFQIGTNCTSVCSPNPCQNGGTCTNGVASYICNCKGPFTGINCTKPLTMQEFMNCDFETGFCNWIHPQISHEQCGNFFYWSRYQPSIHYYFDGPSTDHTTGSSMGHYIYIQPFCARKEGDKAHLLLKPVNGTDCLKFYYHMHGNNIGSLNVYVNGTRVFHKSSNQGNRWLPGEIEFQGTDTEIMFEGIRGNGYDGDIALDDFQVGISCSKDIDDCNPNPCQNNGTCKDLVKDFECQCPGRWLGKICDADIVFDTKNNSGRYGPIQEYVITKSGWYKNRAGGATGGTHSYNYGWSLGTYYGGKGATMEGRFNLPAGTVLKIVVGQRGGNSVEVLGGQKTTLTAAQLGLSVEDNAGTGGGGGTFVYKANNILLIAAGGGGGASSGYSGIDGQAGTSGTSSRGYYAHTSRAGGSGGQPGQCNNGGMGAGWLGQGCARSQSVYGERGGSLAQGWVGGQAGSMNSGYNGGPPPGACGGFGGGGGGAEDIGASGGGGGYSGGGSGTFTYQGGGGGGSYCAGSGVSCHGVTGGNTEDNGFVHIGFMFS